MLRKNNTKPTIQNRRWNLIQAILLLLLLFWPFKIKLSLPIVVKNTGVVLLIVGSALFIVAVRTLKHNFRSSLRPTAKGKLITTGLYSFVRHPAYGAIVISSLGLSLWVEDGVRLALSICLLLFFKLKSRVEEKFLENTYAGYCEYKRKVTKKFIPWLI